jgi:hypothetical protein
MIMHDYSKMSPRVLATLLNAWTESLHRQRAYVLLEWPEAINSWSLRQAEEEIAAIRRALDERQTHE